VDAFLPIDNAPFVPIRPLYYRAQIKSTYLKIFILDIPWDAHLSDSKFYEKFYTSDVYINAKQLYPENELELEKKMVCLTPLGKSFVKCCVPDIVISVTKQ